MCLCLQFNFFCLSMFGNYPAQVCDFALVGAGPMVFAEKMVLAVFLVRCQLL